MRIFDKDGTERNWDWLAAKYGAIGVGYSGVGPHFELAEIRETEGPATAMVRVLDAAAVPMSQVLIALSWPGAPVDLTVPEAAAFKSIWAPRAAVQTSDGNGWTGYGLGTGSYYNPADSGGPHRAWILHDQYKSDGFLDFGMLPMTEHMGPLRITFQLNPDGSEPPPEPEPDDVPGLLKVLISEVHALRLHLGA